LPIYEKVTFKTRLQRGNRLQIPKYVRWHYKLEPDQTLKATIHFQNVFVFPQVFFTRTGKDGRVVVPKLILSLFSRHAPCLEGYIVEVTLEPI
jgi:hypothetical protein